MSPSPTTFLSHVLLGTLILGVLWTSPCHGGDSSGELSDQDLYKIIDLATAGENFQGQKEIYFASSDPSVPTEHIQEIRQPQHYTQHQINSYAYGEGEAESNSEIRYLKPGQSAFNYNRQVAPPTSPYTQERLLEYYAGPDGKLEEQSHSHQNTQQQSHSHVVEHHQREGEEGERKRIPGHHATNSLKTSGSSGGSGLEIVSSLELPSQHAEYAEDPKSGLYKLVRSGVGGSRSRKPVAGAPLLDNALEGSESELSFGSVNQVKQVGTSYKNLIQSLPPSPPPAFQQSFFFAPPLRPQQFQPSLQQQQIIQSPPGGHQLLRLPLFPPSPQGGQIGRFNLASNQDERGVIFRIQGGGAGASVLGGGSLPPSPHLNLNPGTILLTRGQPTVNPHGLFRGPIQFTQVAQSPSSIPSSPPAPPPSPPQSPPGQSPESHNSIHQQAVQLVLNAKRAEAGGNSLSGSPPPPPQQSFAPSSPPSPPSQFLQNSLQFSPQPSQFTRLSSIQNPEPAPPTILPGYQNYIQQQQPYQHQTAYSHSSPQRQHPPPPAPPQIPQSSPVIHSYTFQPQQIPGGFQQLRIFNPYYSTIQGNNQQQDPRPVSPPYQPSAPTVSSPPESSDDTLVIASPLNNPPTTTPQIQNFPQPTQSPSENPPSGAGPQAPTMATLISGPQVPLDMIMNLPSILSRTEQTTVRDNDAPASQQQEHQEEASLIDQAHYHQPEIEIRQINGEPVVTVKTRRVLPSTSSKSSTKSVVTTRVVARFRKPKNQKKYRQKQEPLVMEIMEAPESEFDNSDENNMSASSSNNVPVIMTHMVEEDSMMESSQPSEKSDGQGSGST